MPGDKIISVKNLSVKFGTLDVLKKLSLDIKKKEILGIAGASGSGKSTLLNALTGLFVPDNGKIHYTIEGKEFDLYKNLNFLKNYMGYSLQRPCIFPELSVEENLKFFSGLYDIPKKLQKESVNSLIKLMELQKSKDKEAGSLSGGMKRRLDIALALVHKPKVLFLDEPTSDLDPILREKIWNLIHKINRSGTTVVICSHFLTELEEHCERIALLHAHHISRVLTNSNKDLLSEEWIMLSTRKHKYDQIKKGLTKYEDLIIGIVENKEGMIIKTQNSDKILSTVLKLIKASKDEIESIERVTPSIEDIFKDTLKK
jgi:ABC-2 type transport system ATP-binding protein